jgi:ribose transport system substrate-binding protein
MNRLSATVIAPWRRLAVAGAAAIALAGCGSSSPPVAPPPGPAAGSSPAPSVAGKRVGVALASVNHNFFIGMRQGVEEQLQAEGLEGDFQDASDSASAQQQQVDQFIQKGVDAIIMVPVDAAQAVNPVKAANAAGIPIFCIDRRVTAPGATVTATIETDNVAMGQMAAEHALELLCRRHSLDPGKPEDVKRLKSTVVHLWGLEAASSAQDRATGFEKVFNTHATPGVKVIKQVGNFNAATSQQVMAPVLTSNPDVELIYCHNDDNAIGALNAVIDVKKGREQPDDPKRIFIVSIDGNRAAIEEIRKGNIEATVSQEPIEMGRVTVQQVKKVLEGSQPDSTYIPIRHHLVTKGEADELQGKLWADQLKDAR